MTSIESPRYAFRGKQAIATNYYGVGGDASLIQHIHMQWDELLVCSGITFWSSNFPEVAIDSVVAGDWIQENPPTGYTAFSPAGAGSAATPLVIVVPGGTAGGCSIHIGNLGSRLLRIRVVATTAGFFAARANGKD